MTDRRITPVPSTVVPLPPGTVVCWGHANGGPDDGPASSCSELWAPAMRVTGERVDVVDGNGYWHRLDAEEDGIQAFLLSADDIARRETPPPPGPGPLTFDRNWLLCPSCGFEYTSVTAVTVRDSTGKSATVAAAGEDDHGRLEVAMPGQPIANRGSDRRWDVTLQVGCEGCAGSEITFAQHKGQTDMQIYRNPATPEPADVVDQVGAAK